jgi:hypothetical protein
MCFFLIKQNGHLIAKKLGTKMYFTNKFESNTYVTHVLHFSPLSLNSTLPLKIKYNWVLILAQNDLIIKI